MAQGQRLSDEQIETIRLVYAETGSGRQAARAAGCSEAAARKYCKSADDDFTQLRAEKRADIIERLAEVRTAYLEHMLHESVLAPTNARDSAVIVGILTDKHQLLTGAATARTETGPPDSGRFTLDEIEKLAAVAERVKAGVS